MVLSNVGRDPTAIYHWTKDDCEEFYNHDFLWLLAIRVHEELKQFLNGRVNDPALNCLLSWSVDWSSPDV